MNKHLDKNKHHDGLVPMLELSTLRNTIIAAGFQLCVNRDRPELPALTPLKSICSGGGQFEVIDAAGKLVASFCTQAGVVDWVHNQSQL